MKPVVVVTGFVLPAQLSQAPLSPVHRPPGGNLHRGLITTPFLFYEHFGFGWHKKIDTQDPISIWEGLSLLVFFPGSFCSGVFVSPCRGMFSL